MAEIFAFVTGGASLIDIAIRASQGLHGIAIDLIDAPHLVTQLANEATDIQVVLAGAEDALHLRPPDVAVEVDFTKALDSQLATAQVLLRQIEALTTSLQAEKLTV